MQNRHNEFSIEILEDGNPQNTDLRPNEVQQNSLLRPNEVQLIDSYLAGIPRLIRLNQEEALRRDQELQSQMEIARDTLRPTQYNFVNSIIDQVLNGANRVGYRYALAGYLASSVVSIIAVTSHCTELYKEATGDGMMRTAKNIEAINSLNRYRTEMRHNCIEEGLPFAVPAAIFIPTLTLLALAFRARREGQERVQGMPENPENQLQAEGGQPRQAPSVVGDVVLVGSNLYSPRRD